MADLDQHAAQDDDLAARFRQALAERNAEQAERALWETRHMEFVRYLIAAGRLTDMIERED